MENENIENTDLENQTVEVSAKAEAEKEAESVYKQELAKLQEEKEAAEEKANKAEDIARQKSGAIKEEREARKAAEELAKAAGRALEEAKFSEEELDKKLEAKLNAREFNQRIKQVAEDPDEQKLIQHHYENSIVRTGNVEADLAKAIAIANSHLVEQAKQQQIEREQNEAVSLRFQGGSPSNRPGKPVYEVDPTLRAAASLADRLGMGDIKKYLGK